MRLRKKKWSSEVFEQNDSIIINEFDKLKGQWKNQFDRKIIRLEIGSGKGQFWHQLAIKHPNDLVIALEKDYTALSIALKKMDAYENHGNKYFIYDNAHDLSEMFAEGELDVIYLNFSDPWPKVRHARRRLTHDSMIAMYDKLLSDQGEIRMKTDNQGLFEYSLSSFTRFDYELIHVSLDYAKQDKDHKQHDPATEYEEKFISQGLRIYQAVWRKKNVK